MLPSRPSLPRSFRAVLASSAVLLCSAAQVAASPARALPPQLVEEELVRESRHLGLPANVSRVLEDYGAVLDFLPLDRLQSLQGTKDSLELVFDFGGESSRTVRLAGTPRWVLVNGEAPGSKQRVKRMESDELSLEVSARLRFALDGDHIVDVREGDLCVNWGWFSFDLSLETRVAPGRVDVDDEGRAIVEQNADERPILRGGSYVPKRYDRWVLFSCRGKRVWMGVDPT